jgi:hypothetical protein
MRVLPSKTMITTTEGSGPKGGEVPVARKRRAIPGIFVLEPEDFGSSPWSPHSSLEMSQMVDGRRREGSEPIIRRFCGLDNVLAGASMHVYCRDAAKSSYQMCSHLGQGYDLAKGPHALELLPFLYRANIV